MSRIPIKNIKLIYCPKDNIDTNIELCFECSFFEDEYYTYIICNYKEEEKNGSN